ncbi:EcsC family protein [Paenibacillus sp. GSMTC-2017]|uniref:SHOCT domain-containing protein n=1 Tax=Paenibacillus sp. GSMTC-2017 TaxID=2794350 RepID=UPI0018D9D603|nr:SHOCT domain-containing protein [Paenibacillus sp. GSMTC-2017]MBH5318805.1 EcsC family protein [Paenibacillus sp. GSMTC-2017]
MASEQKPVNDTFKFILVNAVKIPGVKVDRREFLTGQFAEYDTDGQLSVIIEKGPIKAGVSLDVIDKMARTLIEKRTLASTAASTVAGIPGGLTMAAMIPADTLQFFGVALRMSQELAYLFGRDDLWADNELDSEKVIRELILFLGVMFGVAGSASMLRILTASIAEHLLKKIPQQAFAKTLYYPIVKKAAAYIGINISKKTFAQGASKIVPILGGIISGGLTYFSMKPMGNRLRKTLYEAANDYSELQFNQDYENVRKSIQDSDATIIEGECIEIDITAEEQQAEKDEPCDTTVPEKGSVADELLKFKQLLDMGAITQEEYDRKKFELLNA